MRSINCAAALLVLMLAACGGGGGGGGSGDGSDGGQSPPTGDGCPNVNTAFSGLFKSSPASSKAGSSVAPSSGTESSGFKPTAAPRMQATGTQALSGTVTYQRVPHDTDSSALDYGAIFAQPVRGATVLLLDNSGATVGQTTTNDAGAYSFMVDANMQRQVRVLSELQRTAPGAAQWEVRVVDNTQGNAVYALDGALTSTGSGAQTRDLQAQSGWTGSAYTQPRAAGPFAMLDDIYGAMADIEAVDPDVVFPELRVNWSVNNTTVNGNRSAGEIGTSFYQRVNGLSNIFVLGDANNDTDEYDDHVIVHEWGHYFEDRLSRSDSIGGPHGRGDRLDMRVAFGEGFGNALSGMITDDPVYRDSFGTGQSLGFDIDVESGSDPSVGWYSEGSVQLILYDLYDSTNDSADSDSIALGLGPIYDVLVSSDYRTADALTSIFGFASRLRDAQPAQANAIDALLAQYNIVNGPSLDTFGSNETNSLGNPNVLPVYTELQVGTPVTGLFSIDDFGEGNRLSNWRFARVDIPTGGDYQIDLVGGADPDYVLIQDGVSLRSLFENSAAAGRESDVVTLAAGQAVIAMAEFANIDQSPNNGTDACLAVRVIPN